MLSQEKATLAASTAASAQVFDPNPSTLKPEIQTLNLQP
jgi:hypothetical protein